MRKSYKALFLSTLAFFSFSSSVAYGYGSSSGLGPPSSKSGSDQLHSPPPKPPAPTKPEPRKPLIKPTLPVMEKPFGMPGVIGYQNGKWEGTDYLGFLSNNIGISVEILKPEGIAPVSDASVFENQIAAIFGREDINPRADVSEGPPLPFLHLLIFIYPVDQDHFVVFGNERLFEQVQVVRKEFTPAGVWQAITWETQDMTAANGANLDAKVKELVDKLGIAFAKRYRDYNVVSSTPK